MLSALTISNAKALLLFLKTDDIPLLSENRITLRPSS